MVITTTSSSSSTSSTHETQLAAAKLPISNERGEVVEMSVTLSNPNYFEACLLRLASAPIKWRAGYVKSLHTVSMPVDTKVNPGERRRGTIASAATMQSQRWHVRSVVTNEPCARFNAQFELHTSEINLLYPRSLSPQVHAPTPRKIYHKYLSPTLSCCCLLRGHLEACKFGSEWWCGRQLYLYWLPEHPHSRISFLNIGSSISLPLYLSQHRRRHRACTYIVAQHLLCDLHIQVAKSKTYVQTNKQKKIRHLLTSPIWADGVPPSRLEQRPRRPPIKGRQTVRHPLENSPYLQANKQ